MISSICSWLTCRCCYPITDAEEGLIHTEEEPVDVMTSASRGASPIENFVDSPRSASGHVADDD